MKTFDLVDDKLSEADFFYEKMSENRVGWFEMRCFFSAFISSSRSVTFALQSCMAGTSGFERWYERIQLELKKDELARFFHNCRTDNQHIGFNHIVSGAGDTNGWRYFFGKPTDTKTKYHFIPNDDVVSCCFKHMTNICSIIDRAYLKFGLEIDPDQIFTPNGMMEKGWGIEDIEREADFPAMYTDIETEMKNKDLLRLQYLRQQIPGSSIKPLLEKYLKRPLAYPCEPYKAPV
jgi:hypothetical protein